MSETRRWTLTLLFNLAVEVSRSDTVCGVLEIIIQKSVQMMNGAVEVSDGSGLKK